MKRFSGKLLWFLAALPIIWLAFVFFAGKVLDYEYRKNVLYTWSGYGFTNTRLKEADTVKDVDVLIIGSSHAYRGFDVRVFRQNGIRSFNLGSSSQSPLQSEYLLKKYLKKINPRLVLVEVGFMSLGTDGVEGGIDIVSNVDELDADLFQMVTKINNLSLYNTTAYAVMDDLTRKNRRTSRERTSRSNDVYIPGGFVEHKIMQPHSPLVFKRRPVPIKEDQQEALERILALCRAENVRIILVQAPVVHKEYTAITNQHEFEQYLQTIGSGNYFNFNKARYDESLFYDHHHLNQKGVLVFNNEIMPVVKRYLAE